MELDPQEAQANRSLLKAKTLLEKKIHGSNEIIEKQMKKKKKYEKNEKKLSMFKNPAYGPRFVGEGSGIKKPTHRSMVAQIKSITLPIVFYINKKLIASNHESMSRCIEFSTDGRSFVTTCKGGRMNLWDAASSMEDPHIIRTLNASAESKQRWPEDVAFSPNEDRLVAVYKNADVDRQVALVTFSRQNEAENNVQFLTHENMCDLVIKDGVRRVMSIPDTDSNRFITAGEDRSIIVWDAKDEVTRTLCHRTWHKNDVNGLCRVKNKAVVVSVGLDKRVIGYDLREHKKDSCLTAKDPCLGIVGNPVNPNLLLIHTRNRRR